MKRRLEAKELAANSKSIQRLGNEKSYLQYLDKHTTLMLEEGLQQNFIMQKHEYEVKQREIKDKLSLIENQIKELERQNKEGVDIKEEPKEE